ncbi:MAG: AbiTii domain-containing protein [Gemmatimonadaceae bacterium]
MFPWPGNLVALVQHKFVDGMVLGDAWLQVGRSAFVGAVDSVRTRILSFALDVEARIGNRIDEGPNAARTEAVKQIFNTHIYGSVANLAQGSHDVVQHHGVASSDLPALIAELVNIAVPKDEITELEEAIKLDGAPPRKERGPKVTAWLGKMISKAASGVWNVATSTATTVLPKLLGKYYGLSQ